MTAWNPRYVAYATATGMDPAQRLAADKSRRTGCMTDFIIWIGQRWQEWGGARPPQRTREDHEQFDAWLATKYRRIQQLELFP